MMRVILPTLLLLVGCQQPAVEPTPSESEPLEILRTEAFDFEVDGNRLSGLLDRPADRAPRATIVIVHGYGETSVVENDWYRGLRSRFAEIGIGTLLWDKPGCGASEGEFDINQPVQSSAREVVAAIRALRERGIEGSETVGLWGVSRAGWIAPLAIAEEASVAFWISVSGTDDKENARYLIESNLRLEGHTEAETQALVAEWQARFDTVWQGGTYREYLDAAPNLSDHPFMHLMGWGGHASEQAFLDDQERFRTGEYRVDEVDGLMVHVPEFRSLLASIEMPVLAIFGEKDTNVDWRKTSELYRTTIGANPAASLTVHTFPDGDHNLKRSETGGIREMREQPGDTPYVDGYPDVMFRWLVAQGFGSR